MTTKTQDRPKTTPSSDRSLYGLLLVLLATNVWFFSQALTYF